MNDPAQKVLVVDDDATTRALVAAVLGDECRVIQAATGEEALALLDDCRPALVLLDVLMPGLDGYETCRRIKSSPHGAAAQVVMISVKSSWQEQRRAYDAGADDYLGKPIDPLQLTARVQLHFRLHRAMAEVKAVQGEIASHHVAMKRLAEERAREIIATQDVAIYALATVAESRDEDTGQHLLRIRSYSQMLAEQLGREAYAGEIDTQFLDDVYRSSVLHDIGKVAISDTILLKPGRLTPDEFELMKQHTTIGAEMLQRAIRYSQRAGFLSMAATIARSHHERFDGLGYPDGLQGDEIPLPARIVALADVFDALTSRRPYKPPYSPEFARETIRDGFGTQFDPHVVSAFLSRYDDFAQLALESQGGVAPPGLATLEGLLGELAPAP